MKEKNIVALINMCENESTTQSTKFLTSSISVALPRRRQRERREGISSHTRVNVESVIKNHFYWLCFFFGKGQFYENFTREPKESLRNNFFSAASA